MFLQLITHKTVYLVRHGQSEDNIAPVIQSSHSPLSETGKQQASLIALRASKLTFEKIIASPLSRAKETANAIGVRTGVPIEFSELFVERRKPPAIEGKPHTDEAAVALWREWNESLYTSKKHVAEGENYDTINARAIQALEYLKEVPEKELLVVTHGFFLRTLVANILIGEYLTPTLFKHFQRLAIMENTGLSVIKYQSGFVGGPGWRVAIYNDHAHLAE